MGFTALHRACHRGYHEIVKFLVISGSRSADYVNKASYSYMCIYFIAYYGVHNCNTMSIYHHHQCVISLGNLGTYLSLIFSGWIHTSAESLRSGQQRSRRAVNLRWCFFSSARQGEIRLHHSYQLCLCIYFNVDRCVCCIFTT